MNPTSRRSLLGGLLLAPLVGCASLPTSGPVEPVGPAPTSRASGGVAIAPQPPPVDGDPEVILAGFLAAMSSVDDDYSAARQYLTPAAQKLWKPASGTTIYEAENNKPVTTATSAALNVPVVGMLDPSGRYTPGQGKLVHDFGMGKVNDQWRISRPPAGLLIARYVFDRYYHPLSLAFLDAAGTKLVNERAYRQVETLNPTDAVRALLGGPSAWLAPAVATAFPADTRLSVNAVVVNDGVAEVSLTEQVASLGERQRIQLAAQLVATLLQFEHVDGVRVLNNGQPFQVPSADGRGVVGRDALEEFQLLDGREEEFVYVVQKGRVGLVDTRLAGGLRPLEGALGRGGWGDNAGQIGIQRSGQLVAVVNRAGNKLFSSTPSAAQPTLLRTGTNMLRPQVTSDGSVWTIDHSGQRPTLVRVPGSGPTLTHPLPGLEKRVVLAFRISPDQTRIALVVQNGKQGQFGLMRLRSTDPLSADGWRMLPLTSTSGPLRTITDVAWCEPESLAVLGSVATDGSVNVFRLRSDGSFVENLGPSGTGGSPSRLSAFPRRSGMTAAYLSHDDEAFRFEGAYRWQRMLRDVTDVAMPG